MASVRKRGKTWSARWLQADKSESEKGGFSTKKEAQNFANEQEIRVKRGRGITPLIMKMTVIEFIDEVWKQTLDVRPQTKRDYENTINKYILPYFGHIPMSTIKPADIKSWQVKLKNEERYFGKALSEYTTQKYVNLLATILKSAKLNKYIDESPFDFVRRPKVKATKKVRPLELGVIRGIAEAIPEEIRLMIWMGFFTGMRPSEILGVTFDKIDFDRKIIKVDQQISRDPEGDVEPHVKTSTSIREVPLSLELEKLIKDHVRSFGLGPKSLLFKNRDGGLLRYKHANRYFSLAARPLGVPVGEGMHVLRHTCASTLIRSGASIKAIQVLLGHKEISETLDTYGHLFPEDLSNLVATLDSLFLQKDSSQRSSLAIIA